MQHKKQNDHDGIGNWEDPELGHRGPHRQPPQAREPDQCCHRTDKEHLLREKSERRQHEVVGVHASGAEFEERPSM